MQEHFSKTDTLSFPPDDLFETVGETRLGQIINVAEMNGLKPPEGYFDKEPAKAMADFAKDISDQELAQIVKEYGYEGDEVSEEDMSLLNACLRAPYFAYIQQERDQSRKPENIRQLCEFNEQIRDMLVKNGDKNFSDIVRALQGTLQWAGVEGDERVTSKYIEYWLNGARAEVIVSQLAQSEAAENANIGYIEGSTNEDLLGTDFTVTVPVVRSKRLIEIIKMKMDIKNDLRTVRSYQTAMKELEGKNYGIDHGKIVWYSGVTEERFGDAVTLDEKTLEKESEPFVIELQQAAKDLDLYNFRRSAAYHMGSIAVAV